MSDWLIPFAAFDEGARTAAERAHVGLAGEKRPFAPGDVIFVEAGAPHRFEDFTGDFAAWAVFWGPEGGEA